MNKIIILIILIFNLQNTKAQNADLNEEEILNVLKTFTNSIKNKDSISYLKLFHREPIVWEGINKDKSLIKDREKDPSLKEFFSDNYKKFIQRIVKSEKIFEENYDNIQIINDDKIATVFFDYTFLVNDKILNWGSESWQLVRVSGNWKIKSVTFSTESNNVVPFPNLKERKKIRKNFACR